MKFQCFANFFCHFECHQAIAKCYSHEREPLKAASVTFPLEQFTFTRNYGRTYVPDISALLRSKLNARFVRLRAFSEGPEILSFGGQFEQISCLHVLCVFLNCNVMALAVTSRMMWRLTYAEWSLSRGCCWSRRGGRPSATPPASWTRRWELQD